MTLCLSCKQETGLACSWQLLFRRPLFFRLECGSLLAGQDKKKSATRSNGKHTAKLAMYLASVCMEVKSRMNCKRPAGIWQMPVKPADSGRFAACSAVLTAVFFCCIAGKQVMSYKKKVIQGGCPAS